MRVFFMGNSMAKIRHELFEEIEESVTSLCKELKLSDDVCSKVGCSVSDLIANLFAGQVVYFPSQTEFRRKLRDVQIYKKFNGSNYQELAKEFGYSDSGIRRVISRVQKKARNQGNV